MTEESLFAAALKIADEAERRAFLERACAGDNAARERVEALLKAGAEAGSFFDRPPAGLDATLDEGAEHSTDAPEPASAASLPDFEPSDRPDRIGRLGGGAYEVIEVVGRGGMGVVLRALEVKLGRIVALKVMSRELAANPMAVKRFLREAKMAAAVVHEHVVTIHAIDDAEPAPFLVMQYVEGQSLQQKLDRDGALRLPEILRIGMQAAAGLAAAHRQGVIHRDVKPANILLENGVERVKITDFGLARAADDLNITRTGQIAGTPQYMSPEQAQGQPVDARSDLFSLGSVLYAMCAGRPPFRADSAVAVLRRVCDDEPRPIREVNPDIPDWLEQIVRRLLAKRPEDRFQSAAEVAELLAGHLGHVQQPGGVARPGPVVTRPQPADADPFPRSRTGRHAGWIAGMLLAAAAIAAWWLSPILWPPTSKKVPDTSAASIGPAPRPVPVAWGQTFDPDGDCEVVQVAPDFLRITIPGTHHDLNPTWPGPQKWNAPRMLRNVDGDFTAQVRVVPFDPPKAGTSTSGGSGYRGAGLLVWIDERNFLRFFWARFDEMSGTQPFLNVDSYRNGQIHLQRADYDLPGDPTYLQIERRGDVLLLSYSADGESWSDLAEVSGLPLRETLPVGVAAINAVREEGRFELERFAVEIGPSEAAGDETGAEPAAEAESSEPPRAIAPFDAAQTLAHQEAWAEHLGVPVEQTNSLGMKLRLIPPGEFLMGSSADESGAALREAKLAGADESWINFVEGSAQPQHTVQITRPFYLGTHEVTVGQFKKFVDESGYRTTAEVAAASENKDDAPEEPERDAGDGDAKVPAWRRYRDAQPVFFVSWRDAQEFCYWLSAREDRTYRLPTEAQWEYACRAGTTSRWSSGDDPAELAAFAWFAKERKLGPDDVGRRRANPFGLFDMHGNVYEWCVDWHMLDFYRRSPRKDPVNLDRGTALGRVVRGGGFGELADQVRSAARSYQAPDEAKFPNGFRVAIVGKL